MDNYYFWWSDTTDKSFFEYDNKIIELKSYCEECGKEIIDEQIEETGGFFCSIDCKWKKFQVEKNK